eukprot:294073-Prorocentrum_minimum.AAC.1
MLGLRGATAAGAAAADPNRPGVHGGGDGPGRGGVRAGEPHLPQVHQGVHLAQGKGARALQAGRLPAAVHRLPQRPRLIVATTNK